MTVYELEKRATPGPLVVVPIADPYWSSELQFDIGYAMYIPAKVRTPSDAALLAHRYNNFMRALEALKEINNPDMPSHEWKHWLAALPALIAELEEVK